MPSKDIFNYALNKIENLDLSLIAPQHGSIIKKEYIKNLINDMKNLDCGLYIEKKYNRELLDTINKLQEKEKTIQERNKQLFEQSKRAEIGEMVGNIAHQWRQPLAIVDTIISILKEKNSTNTLTQTDVHEKLLSMQQRINYMSDTITDFMNYYKPNKEKSIFNIYDAINRALEISAYIKNEDILTINITGTKEAKIFGLMNEFVQVIVSLLTNIYDTKDIRKLKNITINIDLQKINGEAILSICDNAGGIDENILPKIFNPYFTTKHQSIGTGLGLHIAKMIIEDNMNGYLSVTNKDNGAKFSIRIKCEN
jgi:C4-dicarboxylate-specific signal transduction histidine kinase